MSADDDDGLAAELAFGLLDADEAEAARRRAADDAAFARSCGAWQDRAARLAPGAHQPLPSLWAELERRIAGEQGGTVARAPGRVLRLWQGATALSAAIAAALVLVVALRPPVPVPPRIVNQPALVALLVGKETKGVVAVSYSRTTGELTLVPSRFSFEGKSPELWVVPPGAKPVAVCLLEASGPVRRRAEAHARRYLQTGTALAISIEPAGGSTTGAPTGPIVVTGTASLI